MNRFTRTAPLILAAASIATLGGCSVYSDNPAIGAPSQSATAALKGRAFRVETVTTARDVKSIGGPATHCLPDRMYAAMLKHDLKVAFKHEGLTSGSEPAIPVNVAIKLRVFETNVGGSRAGSMAARVSFAGHSLLAYLKGGAGRGYWNQVPDWQREKRLIPGLTVTIARGLHNIQTGKSFKAGFAWFGAAGIQNFVPGRNKPKLLPIGVLYPMSVSQIEAITGKTGAQLEAICKANITKR